MGRFYFLPMNSCAKLWIAYIFGANVKRNHSSIKTVWVRWNILCVTGCAKFHKNKSGISNFCTHCQIILELQWSRTYHTIAGLSEKNMNLLNVKETWQIDEWDWVWVYVYDYEDFFFDLLCFFFKDLMNIVESTWLDKLN